MKEEIVEELGKDIKDKQTMSKEYEGKVNKRIFSNILIATVMLVYLIIVILGSKNIENDIFIVDLKVCSIFLSLLSIFIFERSYKSANGKLCIYGIETLVLAILTLIGVYVFQIIGELFTPLISAVAIIGAIYYLIKSIGIYTKSKKDYIKSQSDINEIVREELPETVETKRRRNILESQMEEYNKLNNNEDIVATKSRTIKTSSRKVDVSVGFDEEDDYREKKVIDNSVEEKDDKPTKKQTTTKKTTTKKTTTKKTVAKKTATKKDVEKEEKPKEEKPKTTKKTTAKKSTTKTKAVKDEEKTMAPKNETIKKEKAKQTTTKKTATKKTTTKKNVEEPTEKPAKKQTTRKTTSTRKKASTTEE